MASGETMIRPVVRLVMMLLRAHLIEKELIFSATQQLKINRSAVVYSSQRSKAARQFRFGGKAAAFCIFRVESGNHAFFEDAADFGRNLARFFQTIGSEHQRHYRIYIKT